MTLTPEMIQERIKTHKEKKNRYKRHGVPVPNGMDVDEGILRQAREASFNTDSAVIKFLREEPRLIKHRDKGPDGKQYQFGRGNPIGAIVAFQFDDGIRVGWSKYNKTDEPLIFTKKDAKDVAFIRAFDSIHFSDDDATATTGRGTTIPYTVVRELKVFLNHLAKIHPQLPVNVTFA